jgi:hypothetical protein
MTAPPLQELSAVPYTLQRVARLAHDLHIVQPVAATFGFGYPVILGEENFSLAT